MALQIHDPQQGCDVIMILFSSSAIRSPLMILMFLLHLFRKVIIDEEFELGSKSRSASCAKGQSLKGDVRVERGTDNTRLCLPDRRTGLLSSQNGRH